MTSYSTSIVTLVLFCRVSEILELLYSRKLLFQHPTPIPAKISGVPHGVDPWCLGCK